MRSSRWYGRRQRYRDARGCGEYQAMPGQRNEFGFVEGKGVCVSV